MPMPRRKRGIVIDRYVKRTLAEIATVMRISPMRVWQIEQRALRKLRVAFEAQGMRGNYDGH